VGFCCYLFFFNDAVLSILPSVDGPTASFELRFTVCFPAVFSVFVVAVVVVVVVAAAAAAAAVWGVPTRGR